MTISARAQRLVDEFEDGSAQLGGFNIRHGIAAVLRHLADTDDDWDSGPARVLRQHADALTAPSLLDRALSGDFKAARQFLHEAGFTDKEGQWLPQYLPTPEATNA
jgi:hypothetical protein